MASMYEIIEFLCKRKNITIAQMCRDTDLRQGLISDLKHGRSKKLSATNMQTIAQYFNVSTDIFNEGVFEETLPNGADFELLDDIFEHFQLASDKNKKKPATDNGSGQGRNIVRMAGRDGSYIEKHLSDADADLLWKMIERLPDAGEDL